ncbi:hypothetical protein C8F04DRAFT_970161, partial [Mycena alexandri]
RRFVLLKGLWLKDDVFEAKIDDKYDETYRFDGHEVQGQLRDILAIIPEEYRGKIRRAEWFEPGDAIYDCAPGDILTPALRAKLREEIGWNGEEYASVDVPILHENESAKYDIHSCFLSPVPMRLFVALIRGPTAAMAMLKSVEGVTSNTDDMEHIHRIDHAEAGAIAASCTLAVWGKSVDVQLKARGDTTNIDYEARFDEYLEILTTGLRMKNPSILHVFAEWDRIVFPNAKASAVDPAHKKEGKSEGLRRAMATMRAEVGQDEEGNSADGDGGNEDEGR